MNSGCLSSSEEVGLSEGDTSRQRIVRSLRAGLLNWGRGGGVVVWPICRGGGLQRRSFYNIKALQKIKGYL